MVYSPSSRLVTPFPNPRNSMEQSTQATPLATVVRYSASRVIGFGDLWVLDAVLAVVAAREHVVVGGTGVAWIAIGAG